VQNNPVLGEEAVKVSEHVWAIMGWPNIAIVVGTDAVLVVDTGLGPKNGATIARVFENSDRTTRSCSSRQHTSIRSTRPGHLGFPPGRS
jgi:hypothetical protein